MIRRDEDVISAALNRFWEETAAVFPTLSAAAPLVVGVSGGPDSVALWHALVHSGLRSPADLVAAYLDHGWRAAARTEAAFVAALAGQTGSRFRTAQADAPALARARGLTLEEAARESRYDFLAQVAEEEGAAFVLAAHHGDDQAETVLMHLLRGAGMAGLRGMLPAAPLPRAPHIILLRPLLSVKRADIEAYCRQHALPTLLDESNLDTRHYRNRLRHELLPLLATYNPQISDRLNHLATLMAADYDLLHEACAHHFARLQRRRGDGWLELDLPGWRALPLSLRRGLLRYAVGQLRPGGRDVSFKAIELARQTAEGGAVGKEATLPGGVTLRVGYHVLELFGDDVVSPAALPQLASDEPVWLPLPGWVELGNGWVLESQQRQSVDLTEVAQNPDPWQAVVQLPAGIPLWLRSRLPGERFQPLGLNGRSTSLKEAMINRKIPARLRPLWPLVATPQHLVWFVGHQLDERARVQHENQPVWHLRCYSLFRSEGGCK